MIWYPDKKESNGVPKNVFAVSRVDVVVNEEDEVVKMLTGFKDGAEVSYVLDADLSKSDVKSGDIVTLSLDGKNQPTSITKVFSYEEQKQLVTTASDPRSSARYGFWNVHSVKGNDLIVTKKNPGDTILRTETEFVFLDRIPNIYKYNGKTFEKATAKDIIGFSKNPSKYSRVFTATDITTPYICAIYNME